MDKQQNRISHLIKQKMKKSSFIALLSLFSLLLLVYNGFTIFSVLVPLQAESPTAVKSLSPHSSGGKSRKLVSLSSVSSNAIMYAVTEEIPFTEKTDLHNLSEKMAVKKENPFAERKALLKLLRKQQNLGENVRFSNRVKEFLGTTNSTKSCKFQFFMTWISSIRSFGNRELFVIESLFKWHPNGCLIIISNSLDSEKGTEILKPFLNKGLKVTAISPDFNYLFKNTVAHTWIRNLITGKVNPGKVSLGQNLSNLIRLGLLYKFGGIYLDTDVIILKNFGNLKNTIGAQTMNQKTRNWSRLNNAVMIFDKGHPLIYKFIEEFALTFDGNKWGHNGPYLVSRVFSRVRERPGYNNVTILPPMAFYPVGWNRIESLFSGGRRRKNYLYSKWLVGQIRNHSFAVHLWNKQSRKLKVEQGSIIQEIMLDSCIFCT